MAESHSSETIDMIRWTFMVEPDRRERLMEHLTDHGLDVHLHGETGLVATWEEPEGNLDELIEELWALNGEPFEITHEEFHRLSLSVYSQADDDGGDAQRGAA